MTIPFGNPADELRDPRNTLGGLGIPDPHELSDALDELEREDRPTYLPIVGRTPTPTASLRAVTATPKAPAALLQPRRGPGPTDDLPDLAA